MYDLSTQEATKMHYTLNVDKHSVYSWWRWLVFDEDCNLVKTSHPKDYTTYNSAIRAGLRALEDYQCSGP